MLAFRAKTQANRKNTRLTRKSSSLRARRRNGLCRPRGTARYRMPAAACSAGRARHTQSAATRRRQGRAHGPHRARAASAAAAARYNQPMMPAGRLLDEEPEETLLAGLQHQLLLPVGAEAYIVHLDQIVDSLHLAIIQPGPSLVDQAACFAGGGGQA